MCRGYSSLNDTGENRSPLTPFLSDSWTGSSKSIHLRLDQVQVGKTQVSSVQFGVSWEIGHYLTGLKWSSQSQSPQTSRLNPRTTNLSAVLLRVDVTSLSNRRSTELSDVLGSQVVTEIESGWEGGRGSE